MDMKKKQDGLKPFIDLIFSTKIPKVALTVGLIASVITTLAGLVVPLLTRNLVDGFAVSSLSIPLIIVIGLVFIIQAFIREISLYLLISVVLYIFAILI